MLFVLWLIVRLLTRLLVLPDADDRAKELEILVLRHQLRVLRCKTGRPRFTAADRVLLAAVSRVLPRRRWASSFLVTPQTLLRWHRTLVRRKWTHGNGRTPGRPPTDSKLIEFVLRMARQNPRWGCVRICGELRKLGIPVGATTIRTLLRHHGLGPAPRRTGPSWTQFLLAQAEGIVACDLHGGSDPAQEPLRAVLHAPQEPPSGTRRGHLWGAETRMRAAVSTDPVVGSASWCTRCVP